MLLCKIKGQRKLSFFIVSMLFYPEIRSLHRFVGGCEHTALCSTQCSYLWNYSIKRSNLSNVVSISGRLISIFRKEGWCDFDGVELCRWCDAVIRDCSAKEIAVHYRGCFGAIAQLGERYNGIVEVSGSSPLSSTGTCGWGTRIRTLVTRSRVEGFATKLSPNIRTHI